MARHAKIAMDAWRTERVTPRTLLESCHVLRIGPKEIAQYRDGILWVMPLRTRWHIPGGHWRRCSSLQGCRLRPPRAWPLPPMAAPSGAFNCVF
jgi:hypothetical protein